MATACMQERSSHICHIRCPRCGHDPIRCARTGLPAFTHAFCTDEGLEQAAAVNPGDIFELVLENLLESLFMERMNQNEEIFMRFRNDAAFQKLVTNWLSSEAYKKLRSEGR